MFVVVVVVLFSFLFLLLLTCHCKILSCYSFSCCCCFFVLLLFFLVIVVFFFFTIFLLLLLWHSKPVCHCFACSHEYSTVYIVCRHVCVCLCCMSVLRRHNWRLHCYRFSSSSTTLQSVAGDAIIRGKAKCGGS